jgi:hypothetical protein
LLGAEGSEEHHSGVVDEYVCAAQVTLHLIRRRDQAVAVGDVRCDRHCRLAELAGQFLQTVDPAGQQRQPVAVSSEGLGGRRADPGMRRR